MCLCCPTSVELIFSTDMMKTGVQGVVWSLFREEECDRYSSKPRYLSYHPRSGATLTFLVLIYSFLRCRRMRYATIAGHVDTETVPAPFIPLPPFSQRRFTPASEQCTLNVLSCLSSDLVTLLAILTKWSSSTTPLLIFIAYLHYRSDIEFTVQLSVYAAATESH